MSRIINIIKSTGEKEPLNAEKILNTLSRAGADEELAKNIADEITAKAWNGITTREVYKMAMKQLRRAHPAIAARYSLRDAIFRLGPAGFEFERYIMLLLRAHGYRAIMPDILQGQCVSHEVDLLIEEKNRKIMAECKLRQSTNIFINIKDALSTWARFIDLQEGGKMGICPRPDEAWIITNSRFSYDALQYGTCKGMRMLSWNTPKEKPLPAWIDEKKLYPVTVLHSLKNFYLEAFGRAEILLLQDLVKYTPGELARIIKIPAKHLQPLVAEAKQILEFTPN